MPAPSTGLFDASKLSYPQCLRQVDNEVAALAKALPMPPPPNITNKHDWAFTLYALNYLFSDGKLNPADVNAWSTEGYDDQQLDSIVIIPNHQNVQVYIAQFKNQDQFSDGVLKDIQSGLEYIFEEDEAVYKKLTNKTLVAKIDQVRQAIDSYETADIQVLYVTRGKTHGRRLPNQVEREHKRISDYWANHTFSSFRIDLLGPQDLLAHQLAANFTVPDVKLRLRIHPGPSPKSSLLQYVSPHTGVKSMVFTTKADDLVKLVEGNESWIFDENVRVFLEVRKDSINEKVYATCTADELAEFFWLLNNGVTITCKKFIPPRTASSHLVALNSPQIVNGCQTSMTLAKALKDGRLLPDTCLLVRVLETQTPELVDRVTTATNSQYAVTPRDLRSNDSLQRTLKLGFEKLGKYYETKKGEFKVLSQRERRSKVVSNEKCGQACLAAILRKPSVAMARKAAVWEDGATGYDAIFRRSAEELLYAMSVYGYCDRRRKELRKLKPTKPSRMLSLDASVTSYGRMHLTRIMSFLVSNDSFGDLDKLTLIIDRLQIESTTLKRKYSKARRLLKQALKERKAAKGASFVSYFNELKSAEIDKAIDKILHSAGP